MLFTYYYAVLYLFWVILRWLLVTGSIVSGELPDALNARLYYDKPVTQALLSKSHLHSGVMQSDGRGLSFLARSIWHMFLLEDFPTFPTQLYIINQLLKGFFIKVVSWKISGSEGKEPSSIALGQKVMNWKKKKTHT